MATGVKLQTQAQGTPRDVLEYQSPAVAAARRWRWLRMHSGNLTIIGVAVTLVVIALSMAMGRARVPSTVTVNQGQAGMYIAALEQFRHEQGAYPSKLDDLVPEYLPSLPPTRPNTTWQYRVSGAGSSFQLDWQCGDHGCHYDSATRGLGEPTAPITASAPR